MKKNMLWFLGLAYLDGSMRLEGYEEEEKEEKMVGHRGWVNIVTGEKEKEQKEDEHGRRWEKEEEMNKNMYF